MNPKSTGGSVKRTYTLATRTCDAGTGHHHGASIGNTRRQVRNGDDLGTSSLAYLKARVIRDYRPGDGRGPYENWDQNRPNRAVGKYFNLENSRDLRK